jgi:hypothetical protein
MARLLETVIEHKIGVLISSITLPEKFFILGRTEGDKPVSWSPCKVTVILVGF